MDAEETLQQRRRRLAQVSRACEACRMRKIRCDRSNPCSNCRTAGLACQVVNSRTDSGPKRDRIAQLEERVKYLHDRLFSAQTQLNNTNTTPDLRNPSSNTPTRNDQHGPFVVDDTHVYEGSSSFRNQAVQASDISQSKVVASGVYTQHNMDCLTRQLSNLLQPSDLRASAEDYQFSGSATSNNQPAMDLLPSGLVVSILQQIRVNRPIFLCSFIISDPSLLETLCRQAYYTTAPVSLGQATAMYGILHCLLKEFIFLENPLGQEYDLKAHVSTCEKNFNRGIQTYQILAIPCFENVLSLALGIAKAQEEGKPFLCCTLLAAAASHCRMLGYCQETTYGKYQSRRADQMRRVFWYIYTVDKNISLLQGRPPYLQDSEVDAWNPRSSPDSDVRPWDQLLIMAIKFAKLQGRVYDQLYSAAARNAQPVQQAETIKLFSAKLQSWYAELCEIDSTQMKQPQVFELSQKSWDIMYHSTMTLILIKAPTTEEEAGVSQACLQAARAGLRCHLTCFSSYQTADSPGLVSEGEYASWVLHQSSLNPFIAVFLHAIAADSLEDLCLLDDVVAVLEKISIVSNSCQDLFKVCSTFARLGRALVMNDARLENPEGGLQLSNDPNSGPQSGLETFEGIFGEGMLEQLSNYESYNFSALLGNWTNDEMGVVDEAQK
ncbi:Zn(2)-C6 fungal-type domain-containing protein [Fusarium keratoplasticum]|uniref:Zn(2)-C6 fungal-type domain-containing protein n=1 Tax=Fusarium keratoplasticum TaxID=1328300 RepID=A0ACC0QIJ6_9HYPO|nr:Zn(2)-C6 fungal-type domain-containing protein [Fusarium keratoplasticum]KAI8657127.1 Zn(2)-C6 fungal-type domain-containing protein [Fusarium keratoplasticum]KAI8658104.1 Zn(2)-C6 fungal-type domain-containing protein [Fusarium keratoplasticum]